MGTTSPIIKRKPHEYWNKQDPGDSDLIGHGHEESMPSRRARARKGCKTFAIIRSFSALIQRNTKIPSASAAGRS